MNSPWPTVALKELLTPVTRRETVKPEKAYTLLGAHWYAKGLYTKEVKPGSQIRAEYLYRVEEEDFVYNRLFAWKGSFAVSTAENAGCYVSNEFPCFHIEPARLDPQYLWFYFSREVAWNVALGLSHGATPTSRNRLKEANLLSMEIPIPPLPEQRRIVARIETLAAKVEAARELREEAIGETEGLNAATLRSVREMFLARYPSRHLGNIARITSGGTPSREVPDYWNGHIPWTKSGELQDNMIYDAEEFITQEGVDNSSAKLFPIDTVLVALYGQGQTRGRTGLLKIETTTNQACCAVLPTPGVLEPRYTQYWLRSLYYEMREQVRNGAQPNWNARMIKMIEIAIPPLPEQHRIVAHLDALQAKLAQVQQHQAASQSCLEALLPSILDRAFKGEL